MQFLFPFASISLSPLFCWCVCEYAGELVFLYVKQLCLCLQEAERRRGKSKHSQWRNYDDLNEYFWYEFFICKFYLSTLFIFLEVYLPMFNCRSVDCFRLGWPMRADADFFCLSIEQLREKNGVSIFLDLWSCSFLGIC